MHSETVRNKLRQHGEDHPDIANYHHGIRITQHEMKNHKSVLESNKKGLDIKSKLHEAGRLDLADTAEKHKIKSKVNIQHKIKSKLNDMRKSKKRRSQKSRGRSYKRSDWNSIFL